MSADKTSVGYSRDDKTGDVSLHLSGKLLQRSPPTKAREAALREIHENLAAATVLYRAHGDNGRAGVYRAVIDVVEYFGSQGIPTAVLEPLTAVAAAIVDAEQGTESPIFKPNRKRGGGKPKNPTNQIVSDGYLAVVTECCVLHCQEQGMRPYLEPATRMAERLINDSAWPIRVTRTQLREIRERVKQGPATSPDRLLFGELMASELAEAQPLEWVKQLLKHDWVGFPPPKLSV